MNPTKSVSTFTFNTSQIRVVTHEGNPWFVAQDICRALSMYIRHDGTANTNTALRGLDESERQTVPYGEANNIGLKNIASRSFGLSLVSESGLYKIIMRAERTRPEVIKFQDWVTKEVLPSIRKTGAYVVGQPSLVDNPRIDELTLMLAQKAELEKALNARIAALEAELQQRDDTLRQLQGEIPTGWVTCSCFLEDQGLSHSLVKAFRSDLGAFAATEMARRGLVAVSAASKRGTVSADKTYYPPNVLRVSYQKYLESLRGHPIFSKLIPA